MEKNNLIVGIVIGVLAAVVIMAGYNAFSSSIGITGAATANGMPEKCKLPVGQSLEKWKEHLGHHAETQDCLKYY